MKRFVLPVSAVLAFVASPTMAAPPPQTGSVWAQEKAYWRATVAQDDAVYQALWHPAFVGWPCDEKGPVSGPPPPMVRDAVRRSFVMDMQRATKRPGLVSTFYHVRERDQQPDGKIETTDYNITHTWVPTRSGWKILSGMCKHPDPVR